MDAFMNIVQSTPAGVAVVSSLSLAEGVGNEHKAVIQLIRQNIDDLQEFGLVEFQILPRLQGKHGGSEVQYALLNEQQSTLLLTYMRNNDVVRVFKKRLIKAFYDLRTVSAFNPDTLSRADILRMALEAENEKQKLSETLNQVYQWAQGLEQTLIALSKLPNSPLVIEQRQERQTKPKYFTHYYGSKGTYRRRLLDFIAKQTKPVKKTDLARILNIPYESVRKVIWESKSMGFLQRVGHGQYIIDPSYSPID
jgi:phage regulator Rha-like protein